MDPHDIDPTGSFEDALDRLAETSAFYHLVQTPAEAQRGEGCQAYEDVIGPVCKRVRRLVIAELEKAVPEVRAALTAAAQARQSEAEAALAERRREFEAVVA